VPDPQTADTALPDGADVDVVDLLLTQHARIEEQFLLVIGATGKARQQAFDDLVRLLAVHETAEKDAPGSRLRCCCCATPFSLTRGTRSCSVA
jgi:hypothetical protein